MVHAFQLLFIDCNYPKAFVWFIGLHAVLFYFLFTDFYKQTYSKKKIGMKFEVRTLLITSSVGDETWPQKVAPRFFFQVDSNGHDGKFSKRNGIGICFPLQSNLYENGALGKHIGKSYTSSDTNSKLRNRAFIDSATT